MVVLVLWSTKYLTPSLVYLISHPSGRGSSFCKLQKKLQTILFLLYHDIQELIRIFSSAQPIYTPTLEFEGLPTVLSSCYDLRNIPCHLNPLSFLEEKKTKNHYTTIAFPISVTVTAWYQLLINLPQPGGKGPSGSFSADNIEAYLKTRAHSVKSNTIHTVFSPLMCSKISTSSEIYSFFKNNMPFLVCFSEETHIMW